MENILKVNRLEGYTSSVRSATWHPTGTLLVSVEYSSQLAKLLRVTEGNMHLRRENRHLEYGNRSASH
jgi:hypothetical protein